MMLSASSVPGAPSRSWWRKLNGTCSRVADSRLKTISSKRQELFQRTQPPTSAVSRWKALRKWLKRTASSTTASSSSKPSSGPTPKQVRTSHALPTTRSPPPWLEPLVAPSSEAMCSLTRAVSVARSSSIVLSALTATLKARSPGTSSSTTASDLALKGPELVAKSGFGRASFIEDAGWTWPLWAVSSSISCLWKPTFSSMKGRVRWQICSTSSSDVPCSSCTATASAADRFWPATQKNIAFPPEERTLW
mmetsp:Transcript_42439/g.133995  ORF Transcript_42439/g.133995 Transcript_42439/m.133995 type:complete len:250 (-) Transcript_42439:296-1045(-)